MQILCWIETHRRLKWRMASRIASLPEERWTRKHFRLTSWTWQQNQNKKIGWKTQKKMGGWHQWIHKARRNKRKNKVRSHEQQQLGDGGKNKEWKKKKVYEKTVAHFQDRCAKRLHGVFCLNASHTGFVVFPSVVQRPALMAGLGVSSLYDLQNKYFTSSQQIQNQYIILVRPYPLPLPNEEREAHHWNHISRSSKPWYPSWSQALVVITNTNCE